MREIISEAKIVLTTSQEIECPICHSRVSHYDIMPKLEIDFDDIVKQIDAMITRFPNSEDVIKIIISINQKGDKIFGYPIEYRCNNE